MELEYLKHKSLAMTSSGAISTASLEEGLLEGLFCGDSLGGALTVIHLEQLLGDSLEAALLSFSRADLLKSVQTSR